MKQLALLAAAAVLAVGGTTAAYAYAAATPAAPASDSPSRTVLGGSTSGVSSPSFVRTSAGVRPVKPSPGDDHGRHAEPGDDHGRHAEPGDDHGRDGGHGSDD
jgi:hypothetical protein